MSLRGNIRYFQHRGTVRVTGPAFEPFSVYDFKEHIRETDDTKDRYLTNLIKAARELVEDKTGLALISQQRKMVLDSWNAPPEPWWDGVREMPVSELHVGQSRHINLAIYPVISVDTVTVYDHDSTPSVVNISTTFDIDTISIPCRIALQFGAVWPLATRNTNAIDIIYTCGFGTAATDVPYTIKEAVKNTASYMYDNRGSGCSTEDAFVKSGAKSMLGAYMKPRV